MRKRLRPALHLWLEHSRGQPPNQSVKRKKIRREDRIRYGAPKEETHLHDFSGRDPIRHHQAEENNAKRRDPKQASWVDKKTEHEGKQQREGQA